MKMKGSQKNYRNYPASESEEVTMTADKLDSADIGKFGDLVWAIADAYNTEKHLQYSLMLISRKLEKEPNTKDLALRKALMNLLDRVRMNRSFLLKKLLKDADNVKSAYNLWCPFKHLVGTFMQSLELANREISLKNEQEAIEYITIAKNYWEVFLDLYSTLMLYERLGEEEFEKELSESCYLCDCNGKCK